MSNHHKQVFKMMTRCYNYLILFISFSFYEFTREGESKITLTFSYYFCVGLPEHLHQKSSDSKVQRCQVTFIISVCLIVTCTYTDPGGSEVSERVKMS